MTAPFLSIVLPVYNEEDCLKTLHERMVAVVAELSYPAEFLFVNDGSRDNSLQVLKELRDKDKRVKILSLSRNFGHQLALTAGLDHARGDAIITLDSDLQHPPEIIPEMVQRWEDGCDVVITRRIETQGISKFKHLFSSVFYSLLRKISRSPIDTNSADFRLLSRRAADVLQSMKERDRFIRGLIGWIGFRQVTIDYNAPARQSGTSKYSFFSMLRFGLDGLVSFSSLPLHMSTFFGFSVSLLSFLYLFVIIYWKLFTDKTVQGWASVVVLILFLGGVQLISIGIIGAYVGKIYGEIKQRPLYVLQETIGIDPA